ncbi:MAG: sensor histidine kinase, partial [[Eubacterium] sulci]|nr:sensor histidine kinase [[Eubacterium] sulci]
GQGIAPDEVSHVWERYYKSSTHHVRQTDGSGLGLSIVREILNLHKAQYGVNSKLGKGSTFWFELEIFKTKK